MNKAFGMTGVNNGYGGFMHVNWQVGIISLELRDCEPNGY